MCRGRRCLIVGTVEVSSRSVALRRKKAFLDGERMNIRVLTESGMSLIESWERGSSVSSDNERSRRIARQLSTTEISGVLKTRQTNPEQRNEFSPEPQKKRSRKQNETFHVRMKHRESQS